MRLRNAASMPCVRARQPDTASTAFTDHIARHQRASMQHSLSAKPCGETSRFAEHHSTQPYTLTWRHLTASWSTTTQLFTHPSHQPPHHSVTSIPGSTGRTPPALSLQGGWSLRLRCNACRPVILTQCVQLCDHSWYTCERLRIATFTRACFHTPLHKRSSTQRSLSAEPVAEPCGAI